MKPRSIGLSGHGLSEPFSPFSLFLLFFVCCFFLKGVFHIDLEFEERPWKLIQTRAGAPAPVELWYRLKFCKWTRHSRPAGPGCHDNPNYLPLQPSFYTGREPLCSLGICISLGQVLKVSEWTKITHNMNTTEQTGACVWEKVTHCSTSDTLTGISIVKHFVNYSLKHMFSRTVETPGFCSILSRLQ